ncbi:MAG: glycosyltransferase [Candidatus Eremiobacteraeota bacterium]|nr:glycosyltransferase [Candidatus Eremiobacteraeota bacterium]
MNGESIMMEERYPLVSILIPNYNYVHYVGQAVDSALVQTYPNVEVVVSDNCSTDGAWELLNARYGDNPRVRLHQNPSNLGMAGNFDRVLELARGRYIMWLSSDDFLYPTHVAQLEARFAETPKLDVVYGNAYLAHNDGAIYSMRALPGQFPVDYVDARDELVENFTTPCPVCFPCLLFKRDVLAEPGIWGDREGGELAGDWEVVMRLALANKRFAYVAQPSMVIRVHDGQHSGADYHLTGQNVVEFARFVERYCDHPEFVRRMRGRELGVVQFLDTLISSAATMNGGRSPFDEGRRAWLLGLQDRLRARAAVYEPARVRESRVSVVVESAGSPPALLRALDSVVAQRFAAWELVVVDHGAVPVGNVLRAHDAWSRISYLRLPTPHLPGAARNFGLRMIRGEYVAFLDPNSRFTPDHLERCMERLAQGDTQVAYGAARLVLEVEPVVAQFVGEIVPFGGTEEDVALLDVAPALPLDALVLYRGLFDRIGRFHDAAPILDDWEFTLRLARSTRLAPTRARTVDVTARLNLASQRLAAVLPHYLAVLDAVYAAYAVDPSMQSRRAHHRGEVAQALGAAREWIAEPRGLAAFMCALAGGAAAPVGSGQGVPV